MPIGENHLVFKPINTHHNIDYDNESQNVQNSIEYPALSPSYSSAVQISLSHIDTTSSKVALVFISCFLFLYQFFSHRCTRLGILPSLKTKRWVLSKGLSNLK